MQVPTLTRVDRPRFTGDVEVNWRIDRSLGRLGDCGRLEVHAATQAASKANSDQQLMSQRQANVR